MGRTEPSRWMNWTGSRRLTLLAAAGLFVFGLVALRADPRDLQPSPGGLNLAGEFLRAAFSPALDYQSGDLPASAPSFMEKVGRAL